MKTVFFIRHGESKGNASLLTQQHAATELTAQGMRQAKIMADHIVHIKPEAIISSTFARAMATAREVEIATGLPAEYSELFVEHRRPSIQLEKKKLHPHWLWTEFQLWLFREYPNYRHSNEETPIELLQRAHKALAVLSDRPESVLVVVTHSRFMRALYAAIVMGEGITARTYLRATRTMTMRNTAVMKAVFDEGDWRVEQWNVDASAL